MSQLTILFLYTVAALAFGTSRFPQYSARAKALSLVAFLLCTIGLVLHGRLLYAALFAGADLSLASATSLIGLQLAAIALLGAFNESLRGVSAGLLLLGALFSLANGNGGDLPASALSWQMRAHVMTSMFAYGLLTVGTIVAIYALVQDRRLSRGKLSSVNSLFAPLETTERMLFGVSAAGFTVLALSVVSGITFVEDLFAQHLVHKTALSLLALLLFGILLCGRQFFGWRGKRAVYLYLASFAVLSLAYFGSRYILEELLGRSWG
ncbi:MAG: cytochrome c biogenesis protein CcsA [Gammaproteobacteria bacterium]|nr:cytochrome c biogenesis protein CcsA [Gammaproteobacteria bacterium]